MNKNSTLVVAGDLSKNMELLKEFGVINMSFVLGGERINNTKIWQEYVKGKQTYWQLSIKYGCLVKTIQRRIDWHNVSFEKQERREAIILMIQYIGEEIWVLCFLKMILPKKIS